MEVKFVVPPMDLYSELQIEVAWVRRLWSGLANPTYFKRDYKLGFNIL